MNTLYFKTEKVIKNINGQSYILTIIKIKLLHLFKNEDMYCFLLWDCKMHYYDTV